MNIKIILVFILFLSIQLILNSAAQQSENSEIFNVQLIDGDAHYFEDKPKTIVYANTENSATPSGATITTCSGEFWRSGNCIGLLEKDQWIEAVCTFQVSEIGVQFWGDTNDGWARILVDGTEVWSGDTCGLNPMEGSAFKKYLRVSGLPLDSHTIKVENMGIKGSNGVGENVHVYFFGFGSVANSEPTTTITTDVASRATTSPPSVIHPDLDQLDELCKYRTDNPPLIVTNVVRTGNGKRALFEITVTDSNALNYFDIIPENGKIKYAAQVTKPEPTRLNGFIQDQFLILSAAFQDIVGLAAEAINPLGKLTGTYFQIGDILLKNENKDDHIMGLPNGVYWVLMEGDESDLLPDLVIYAVFNQNYCYNGKGEGVQTIYEGLNRHTFTYETSEFSQVRYILGLDIGEVTSPPKVELKDNFWNENPIEVSEITWSGKTAYFVIKVKNEYSGPKVGSITINANPGLVEYAAKIEDTDSGTKTVRDMTNLGCALATDLAADLTGNPWVGAELAALGVMAKKILPNSDNPHEVVIADDLAVSGSYIVKIKAEDNGITPNPVVFVSPVKIAIAVVSRADAANAEAGIPYNTELVQNQLYWSFDRGLDGWERTGSVPPWHTMESAIQWYDQWGGAQGVIVIDACESTPNGYQEVHAKGGIKKSVTLPQDAKLIIFNIVKDNHDGGIRFLLSDSEGQHTLGEEVLSGAIIKQLSYDISAWKDKDVTLEVQTFGAGTDDSGCVGSSHGCGSCCGEYTGIDCVAIL